VPLELDFSPRCAGKYEVDRLIGAGAFGCVYKARHRSLDRWGALKILHATSLRQPGSVERFIAEARITARLSHPHIVQILDFDGEEGRPWIAFEYLEQGRLADRMSRGPLPWGEAGTVMIDLLRGLAFSHDQEIIHRDIMPENALLGTEGYKLIDFGISKWGSGHGLRTESGLIFGTPAYMAPETLRQGTCSPGSDLYALEILFHECLAGVPPFPGPDVGRIVQKHLGDDPDPLPHLVDRPPWVDRLLERLVARDPADRYRDAHDVLADVEPRIGLAGSGATVTADLGRRLAERPDQDSRSELQDPKSDVTEVFPETREERTVDRRSALAGCVALILIVTVGLGRILRGPWDNGDPPDSNRGSSHGSPERGRFGITPGVPGGIGARQDRDLEPPIRGQVVEPHATGPVDSLLVPGRVTAV